MVPVIYICVHANAGSPATLASLLFVTDAVGVLPFASVTSHPTSCLRHPAGMGTYRSARQLGWGLTLGDQPLPLANVDK